jgi:rhodanese-related sulfurtransferase
MRTLTATELNAHLESGQTRPVLLDVREPHEFNRCRIEGSVNIPMHTVPARLTELDPAREIVVICHHGMRSRMVADFLVIREYPHIVNLTGGIDAWAMQIDPGMPRY